MIVEPDIVVSRSTSIPELQVTGGIYRFHWPLLGVTVLLERLREDSRHTVSADIKITTENEGHIHMARLNLMATRSRHEIARHATDRDTLNRDWVAIIEQTCAMAMEHYRTGEPTVNLGDVVPASEPVYRLKPWIVEGEATIIYGEGGIGKSYLAGFMAASVDQNFHSDLYHPLVGKVLYLDYETTADITARRFQSLTKGFGFGGKSNVVYRFCHQSLPSDISEIQRIVSEQNIDLVVIDSAGPACGGDPESASSAINYFTALRSLRKSSITIAHRSKSGTAGPFGSVYWVNYPRMSYELKKSQDEESDLMHVALVHRKVNDGRLQKPLSFKIQWMDQHVVTVTPEALESVPEFATELPLADQVTIELRNQGAMTVRQIAEAIGKDHRTVSTIMSRNKNRFSKVGNDRWDVIGS